MLESKCSHEWTFPGTCCRFAWEHPSSEQAPPAPWQVTRQRELVNWVRVLFLSSDSDRCRHCGFLIRIGSSSGTAAAGFGFRFGSDRIGLRGFGFVSKTGSVRIRIRHPNPGLNTNAPHSTSAAAFEILPKALHCHASITGLIVSSGGVALMCHFCVGGPGDTFIDVDVRVHGKLTGA